MNNLPESQGIHYRSSPNVYCIPDTALFTLKCYCFPSSVCNAIEKLFVALPLSVLLLLTQPKFVLLSEILLQAD
jgi:hypothetical protein